MQAGILCARPEAASRQFAAALPHRRPAHAPTTDRPGYDRGVNFLLLEPGESDADGRCRLVGRRAEHVRAVLRAEVGDVLRAAILDGPRGEARVTAVAAEAVEVACTWRQDVEPQPEDALLLAVPRPKVLARMLAHAAALGFGRIELFRSWRVDKSHLQSDAMQPATQRAALLAGLEQTGRTRLPTVGFHPLFRPFVEDALPALPLPAQRFVADPAAATPTAALALGGGAVAVAIGPDGGFLPYEVERLAAQGFLPVSCGQRPLRTETALAVLKGQFDLLRDRQPQMRFS
jgi:16S rRNA (uracil1498-N3)-methyltransferase